MNAGKIQDFELKAAYLKKMINKYVCYGDEMKESLKPGGSIKSPDTWPLPDGQIYVWNDTSKSVSIQWYDLNGEAVYQETLPGWYDTVINTYAGDKFDAYDESGYEELLLMGGKDIYTVSEDDFLVNASVKISKKRCAPFD